MPLYRRTDCRVSAGRNKGIAVIFSEGRTVAFVVIYKTFATYPPYYNRLKTVLHCSVCQRT